VISVSADEIAEIREDFREVGFEPGATAGRIDRQAVVDFQRYYGLTVDGLIAKQTLSAASSAIHGSPPAAFHIKESPVI
jgi:peptidoglycan hydrolase-like protein with peptidoglycan-binding domain